MNNTSCILEKPKQNRRSILIVEDEEDTASLIRLKFEEERWVVVHAKDGRVASSLIETLSPTSIVLLDMVLPYRNGYELLMEFRNHQNWKHVPIIMISANSYAPDIRKAMQLGASGYIVKADGVDEMRNQIHKVLNAFEMISKKSEDGSLKKESMS